MSWSTLVTAFWMSVNGLKMRYFHGQFCLSEQKEFAGWHIRRIERLWQHCDVFSGQKPRHTEGTTMACGAMSWWRIHVLAISGRTLLTRFRSLLTRLLSGRNVSWWSSQVVRTLCTRSLCCQRSKSSSFLLLICSFSPSSVWFHTVQAVWANYSVNIPTA